MKYSKKQKSRVYNRNSATISQINIAELTFKMSNLTAETAKAALTDVLAALETPDNVQKINAARDNSGNETLKVMQYVFPIVMQVQSEAIKKYGFPEGREGAVQFAQFIRSIEKEDSEVEKLHAQIRAYFLSSTTINSSTDASL